MTVKKDLARLLIPCGRRKDDFDLEVQTPERYLESDGACRWRVDAKMSRIEER